MPKESKSKSVSKILLLFVAAMVILLLVLLSPKEKKSENQSPQTASRPEVSEADAALSRELRKSNRAIPPAPAAEPLEPAEPEQNAVSGYLIDDFRNPKRNWGAYAFNNLKVTEQGVALADGQSTGVLESPALVLERPGNMVAPIWRMDVPKGANVQIEIGVSADSKNWSPWYPVEQNHDSINPIYPDGTPNPNYGAIAGNPYSNGLNLLPFVRYRATLSLTGGEHDFPNADGSFPSTLLLKEMKIYHVDATEGEGVIAHVEYPPARTRIE